MRNLTDYAAIGLATTLFVGGIFVVGESIMPNAAQASSDAAPQIIDYGPIGTAVEASNFLPTACVSHIELRGPQGVHYTLMAPNGDVLHDGTHDENQTVFFENGALPSITHRVTDDSVTHLVLVNADHPAAAELASHGN